MVGKENHQKITAIIPTYNEAARIGRVLDVLITYSHFAEIIVVDDGSTDNTAAVVKNYPVQYIKNERNLGKGHAMDTGVSAATSEVLFFVDADIAGLTPAMIDQITAPVCRGEVDMFIGMRNRKIYYLHSIIVLVPLVGGERAVTKSLWQMLPSYYKHCFRVEAGLNFYAQYYGRGFQYKIFKGLSQVIKEKKYGLGPGLKQRFGMMFNVVAAQCRLQFADYPKSAKNQRRAAFIALQSLLGMGLSGVILVAIYFGPNNLVYKIFAEELQEDPSAPLVRYLLYLTNITAVSTFAIIGVVIFIINFFTFLLTFKKLSYFFAGVLNKIKNNKS